MTTPPRAAAAPRRKLASAALRLNAFGAALRDVAAQRPLMIVALAAFLAGVAGIAQLPPLDRDEARFAQATAQMLESGDFVAIRFQDNERNKKPAGIHWLQATSVATFSSASAREIWAYRLPSLCGAVLAAVFTAMIGARLFDARTGLLAGLLLAAAPGLAGEAIIAKTDAALLAAVVGAQLLLAVIVKALHEGARPPGGVAAGFWATIGAGVLLKGPIAPMIAGFTGAFAITGARRTVRDWRSALRPLSGLAIAVAVVAPWAVAVGVATEGRFFTEAIGGDMLAKVGSAQERHGGPPGYHFALFWLLFWPAAALAPVALAEAVRNRGDWRVAFLLAWLIPSWLVFELASTKLPHYALPLYPAVALLCARMVTARTPSTAAPTSSAAQKVGAGVYFIVGLVFCAVLIAAPRLYGAPTQAAGLAAAVALCAASAYAGLAFWRGEAERGVFVAAAASIALAWIVKGVLLPSFDQLAIAPRISDQLEREQLHPRFDGAPPATLAGYYEPSAVFLLGTQTAMVGGAAAARIIADGAGRKAPRAAVVERREKPAFDAEADALGLRRVELGVVAGLNYSNGKSVALHIYRVTAPVESAVDRPN